MKVFTKFSSKEKIEIIQRLAAEFWIPATISLMWTIYSGYAQPFSWKVSITNFATSFFLASWFTGQLVRINKQRKLDNGLKSIEERTQNLLEEVSKQAKDLAGYSTGADSFAKFSPAVNDESLFLTIKNYSEKYPVFDLNAYYVDLDERIDIQAGQSWTNHRWKLDSLYPNKIYVNLIQAFNISIINKSSLRINAFLYTRNGYVSHEFRLRRTTDGPLVAWRIHSSQRDSEIHIPEGFPDFDPEQPNKIFESP